jgi:hypothetical protein
MKFDFKITCWERVSVPQEHSQKVLDAIASGKVENSSDVYDLLDDIEQDLSCEKIVDTDSAMSVTENGGNSTIEVYEEGILTFSNGL